MPREHVLFLAAEGQDHLVFHGSISSQTEPAILGQVREMLSSSTAAAETVEPAQVHEGSTAPTGEEALIIREHEGLRLREIEAELDNLFWCARSEVFEDGVESEFTRLLERHVFEYGEGAIAALEALALRVNSSILAEALTALGRLDDPKTSDSRFWLLVSSLSHPSPEVRDAAGVGLAALDDPRGATHLRRAADHEPIEELRRELVRTAEYLEA